MTGRRAHIYVIVREARQLAGTNCPRVEGDKGSRDRHCERSEAKQSILPRKVSLDCFASLAMTWRVSVFPRRETPESCKFIRPRKSEGAGNAGCTLHPRSRVQKMHKEAHTSIQVQRRQSDIPCAMVLTVSFVLSSVTGLCCHRRSREALASHELDTSVGVSGPHDFAVRNNIVRPHALSARRYHRVHRIPPHVRDDREPPLSSGETARAGSADLPDGESGIFLREGMDRFLVICPSARSGMRHKVSVRPPSPACGGGRGGGASA